MQKIIDLARMEGCRMQAKIPNSRNEVPLPDNEELIRMMTAEAERLAESARSREALILENALFGVAIDRNDFDRILIVIGRRSIVERNLHLVETALERVVQEAFKGNGFGRLLQFTIGGYAEDSQPLWVIPEVVAYFKQLQEKKPYLLYWMGTECIPTYCQILAGQSPDKLDQLLQDVFASGNFICEHIYHILMPDNPDRARQLSENLIRLASERIKSALKMPG
jgi:hypothetical protein